MGFYVFTTAVSVHYRHCDDPMSVEVVDEDMDPVSAVFKPMGDDYDCAESFPASLFALGYWRTADLTVFDLQTGVERGSFPFRKLAAVSFDETGRRLFFKSGSNVFLLDVQNAEAKQIRGVSAIDRQIAIKGQNQVIVGSQKKGELLRISLKTGSVAAIPLPIEATFFDLKRNPITSDVILIDRKKGIHCVDGATWRLVWSVSLKKEIGRDHAGVGQFSGNGRLFAVAVAAYDHNYTIVLDAVSGGIVRRINRVCYGLPWHDNMVRDDSTRDDSYEAEALDLLTGWPVVARLARSGQRTGRFT